MLPANGEFCVSTPGVRGSRSPEGHLRMLVCSYAGGELLSFGRGLEARPVSQGKKKEVLKYADDMEFV